MACCGSAVQIRWAPFIFFNKLIDYFKRNSNNVSNLMLNIKSIKNYRTETDGLRAIAIIAVIINHFNKDILQSFYLGLNIFDSLCPEKFATQPLMA